MDKLELAKYLLEKVGMPPKQQSTLCCLALLAMAKLTKDTPCRQASNDWIRIHDIIAFIGEHYGVIYAENSRETFRKQAMHAFRTAALIEDNGKATNSPNYRYRITNEFLRVIQSMNEDEGVVCVANPFLVQFVSKHDSLSDIYVSKKKMQKRENFGRYEKIETTETIERKKFKPSPIISPVYGVLDRDYKKEDIQKYESKVDVQKVRDKAFGETKEKPISSTIYEQSETVTLSKPTETAEKIKTIDELLEDTSDVVIDMDNDLENELKEVESKITPKEDVEITKEVPKIEKSDETLESDLFDLIDSMYDTKEGE